MKLNKFIMAAIAVAAIIGSVSAATAHGPHHRTNILVYDYTYDYDSNYWMRVNTYADYVSCRQARSLIVQLRNSGFYVVINGPRVCPRRISYGVYHDVFWVNSYGFYDHWSSYHYNYHHHLNVQNEQ